MRNRTDIFLIEPNVSRAPKTGVARYIRKMVQGLHGKCKNRLVVCTGLNDLPSSLRKVHLPLRYPWRYTSRALYEATFAWENLLLRTMENRLKPNVIFSPFYGPIARTTPQVFTVYDLKLELRPKDFEHTGRLLEIEHRRRCFRRANAIISISNSTRSELLHFYPDIEPNKVHVVPLAVSEHFFQPLGCQDTSKPYFLFVGNRGGPKNFLRLLEAFVKSDLAKNYDLHVISPGTDFPVQWSEAERNLISKTIDRALKLTIAASEEELARAYSGATCLVFPSEHEGFGLPVLEALAAGTIVACSKTTSLPEAGGQAATYFDPYSVDSIAESLISVVNMSSAERKERVLEGKRHARELTWSKCVDKTWEILESLGASDASKNRRN
jgi:glycosyltransferase involved in cell wall biosynthesis